MKQKVLFSKNHPYVRLATQEDYTAVWSIWMQAHVIRWMSFSKQSLEDFRSLYDRLSKQSDIYVMVDMINGEEKIVGVRRIKYLQGNYSHIAEFCSMGIHQDYQGRGYAKKFYDAFENIIAEKNSTGEKNIKRIQLTQSGGNTRAFDIADFKGFQEEAIFPDWLKQEGKGNYSHFIIERFVYKTIDKEFAETASKISSLSYKAKLPRLTHSEANFQINLKNNKLVVMHEEKPVLSIEYHPDKSVIQHIGFLDNPSLSAIDEKICLTAFRVALTHIFNMGEVKKLELFTSNPEVISLCQNLGFWVRGERIGSYYRHGKYHNELALEYSFFGIDDAIDLLKSFSLLENNPSLESSLLESKKIADNYLKNGICDQLGNRYLQNIVYQLVRDSLKKEKLVSLQFQPWKEIVEECPLEFQKALKGLSEQLSNLSLNQGAIQTITANTNTITACTTAVTPIVFSQPTLPLADSAVITQSTSTLNPSTAPTLQGTQ